MSEKGKRTEHKAWSKVERYNKKNGNACRNAASAGEVRPVPTEKVFGRDGVRTSLQTLAHRKLYNLQAGACEIETSGYQLKSVVTKKLPSRTYTNSTSPFD